jgi:hypothetical protein
MDKIKIDHVIGVNGLLEFSRDEKSGISLWEDVGNNVWTWDQIVEASKNVTNQEIIDAMKVDGKITEPCVHDLLNLLK